MAVTIPSGLTDDNEFIDLLNSLLKGLLSQQAPEQLWVIQIDNWFDHKWLRYSGSGSVPSKFPASWSSSFMDRFASVKEQFWQNNLTFPPFAPDRVLGQWSFLHSDKGYLEVPLPKLPHSNARRRSHSNLQRRAENFADSASFVWYSGNTLKNGRGSVMVYIIRDRQPVCWFAAFRRETGWALERTKGVDMEYVSHLLVNV
jgi:hypothetical protein